MFVCLSVCLRVCVCVCVCVLRFLRDIMSAVTTTSRPSEAAGHVTFSSSSLVTSLGTRSNDACARCGALTHANRFHIFCTAPKKKRSAIVSPSKLSVCVCVCHVCQTPENLASPRQQQTQLWQVRMRVRTLKWF